MAKRDHRIKTVDAFAVFSAGGQLLTAKTRQSEAEDAARIIGGTDWTSRGYTVEPVQITRFLPKGR